MGAGAGGAGASWRLPLPPLGPHSPEPTWGEEDPTADRLEAAAKLIGNSKNVARFAARGCGAPGNRRGLHSSTLQLN